MSTTEDGEPTFSVPATFKALIATVKVSSSVSSSWVVPISIAPLIAPPATRMRPAVTKSPSSAVSYDTVSGTAVPCTGAAADNVAVTLTIEPSSTGFGDADSVTVGRSSPPLGTASEDCACEGAAARKDKESAPSSASSCKTVGAADPTVQVGAPRRPRETRVVTAQRPVGVAMPPRGGGEQVAIFDFSNQFLFVGGARTVLFSRSAAPDRCLFHSAPVRIDRTASGVSVSGGVCAAVVLSRGVPPHGFAGCRPEPQAASGGTR